MAHASSREVHIPVLGIMPGEHSMGTVTYVVLSFEKRADVQGLSVQFQPGHFSRMAQRAVEEAIVRTAHMLGLPSDSWTVKLSVPYPGLTMYGDSLSAMVGLSVAALYKGEMVPHDRVITGTVTSDGRIGPVGGIDGKVAAAAQSHLRVVILSDESASTHGLVETTTRLRISHVGSVYQAYDVLTGHMSFMRGR